MGTPNSDNEFNVIQFEKRLTQLKDSQENINACCKWCLEHRQHHKKIVTSWLNVLKRVKIEQRLNLFYLANDVIQYSKRKNYEFVESWGTALQKATTLVRDDKVKHKIVRIFDIWHQRNIYNEEFISDLCGLISVVPTAAKNDEPHEFQASYVINKIKHCAKLETDTDLKLKLLKEHNPKIPLETESLCTSLKDRAHVDDVEKELETYVKHLEGYINALKAEIKCRIGNISVLKQANGHLDKDKKDVKVVANAYRTFGTRIKAFQKKLEEHKATLSSPIPSPDINAPSPSPDSDIELPDDNDIKLNHSSSSSSAINFNSTSFTAGYYNPVPPPITEASTNFVTNGYTSFMGSNFTLSNLSSSLFTNSSSASTDISNNNSTMYGGGGNSGGGLLPQPPPLPIDSSNDSTGSYHYQQSQQPQPPPSQMNSSHMPLLPPPMPPFNTATNESNYNYNTPIDKNNYVQGSYAATNDSSSLFDASSQITYVGTTPTASSYTSNTSYNDSTTMIGSNPFNPLVPTISSADEYNPEQEPDTWEPDISWSQPPIDTDTPESPPMFEKEGFNEQPLEYHDTIDNSMAGASDVDHRVLRHAAPPTIENAMRSRGKDVDHRNLISLTGSPADNSNSNVWNNSQDQDYRMNGDQDYRLPLNIEQLKLPPPPPPPTKQQQSTTKKQSPSPRKYSDSNVESIDMDLSEDEIEQQPSIIDQDNLKVLVGDQQHQQETLKPPPPLPDLPDDVDANTFLDSLQDDLNSQEFTASLTDLPPPPDYNNMMGPLGQQQSHSGMNFPPPPPPPLPSQWGNGNNMPPPNFNSGGGFRGGPPPPLRQQQHHNHPPHHHHHRGGASMRGGYDHNMLMMRNNNNQRGKNRGGNFGNFNRGGAMMMMNRGRGTFGGRGQTRPLRSRGNRGNYQGGY